MQYLLLIYEAESLWEKLGEPERNKIVQEYMTLVEDMRKSGQLIAAEALQQVRTATTVRVREGKRTTTDGPFAETREQLGGYFLVEAKDLDEARRLAARIPSAKWGSIEVRPIQKYS